MSKKVMIVDDSGSFRTVVKLALQKAGYETWRPSTARTPWASSTATRST
jgi:CheY-like chemotaxis protein